MIEGCNRLPLIVGHNIHGNRLRVINSWKLKKNHKLKILNLVMPKLENCG